MEILHRNTGSNAGGTIGSFLSNTATGTQAITGLGLTPKAVLFYTASKADPEAQFTGGVCAFGAASQNSGVTGQWCSSRFSADGGATTSCNGRFVTTACINTHASAAALLLTASLLSWDSDGFTLNWTAVSGTARRIYFVALDGATVNFHVGSFDNTAALGSQSITGLAFQPQLLLFKSDFANGTVHDDVGVCDSALRQWAVSTVDVSALATSNARTIWSDDRAILRWGAGATQFEARVTSLDSAGFTINKLTNDAVIRTYGFLAVSGIQSYAGVDSTPGATGARAVSGLGFRPAGVFIVGQASSTPTTMTQTFDAGVSYGFNINGEEHCVTYTSVGNAAPQGRTLPTSSKVLSVLSGTGLTNLAATLLSYNPTGFTLNWTDAVPSRKYFYLALDVALEGRELRVYEPVDIAAKATHYLTAPHFNTAVPYAEWTINLFKNGEQVLDVGVDMRESPTGSYTFAFENDGEDEAQWTLQVWETNDDLIKYSQTWRVKKKIIEQTVKLLRSRQDSNGGFFKSSYDQEV